MLSPCSSILSIGNATMTGNATTTGNSLTWSKAFVESTKTTPISGLNFTTQGTSQGDSMCPDGPKSIAYPSVLLFGICPDSFWVALIGSVLILIIGIIGNSLSIMITLRRSMRKNPFCKFLTALAITDIVHSIVGCCGIMLPVATHGAFHNIDILGCGSNFAILTISGSISGHLLTTVSIERYLSICCPAKCAVWFSDKRTYIIIALICVINILYISPPGTFLYIAKLNINGQILKSCEFSKIPGIYRIIMAFLFSYAPLLVIIIMNVLIIRGLIQRKDLFSNGTSTISERRKAEIMKTIPILFTVCIAYVVTTAPTATIYILSVIEHPLASLSLQKEDPCPLYLSWTIITLLRLMNYSTNFYLYCLTGSKFRRELYKLVCGDDGLGAEESSENKKGTGKDTTKF